jgi:hypothetical protein
MDLENYKHILKFFVKFIALTMHLPYDNKKPVNDIVNSKVLSMDKIQSKVFISCGQRKESEEVVIAEQIADRLRKKGFDPYIAVQQQTLKGLKENIFEELSSSEYFLFVDFKREKLDEQTWRGSLFCHQELAIASFLDMPVLGFQESGVKKDDGILSYLQANCTPFSDKHTLANVIADKVDLAGNRIGKIS